MQTYKPIAPVCQGCEFARVAKMASETYAFAFCGHPSCYSPAEPSPHLAISIERDFTECADKPEK